MSDRRNLVRRGARGAGVVLLGASALGVLGSLGCGDSAIDGRSSPDAGGGLAAVDAPSGLLDAGSSALDVGPTLPLGEGADPDTTGTPASCFDGRDQDDDMLVDCEDDGCTSTRICCIGSSEPTCCAASPVDLTLPLSSCVDRDPRACTALGARIVSGTPTIGPDHALVPVASAGVDGAIDFPAIALVPRAEHLRVTGRIEGPASSVQLDATAFGLWSPQIPTSSVAPLVAVVASATRSQLSVVVGSRVIESVDLVGGSAEYTIVLAPSGLCSIETPSGTLGPYQLELPAGAVVPVVFGRVTNEAMLGDTTRLAALSITRQACDLPAALVRRGTLVVATPLLDALTATDPSALVVDGEVRVAFAASAGGNAARTLFLGRLVDGAITEIAPILDTTTLATRLAPDGVSNVRDLAGPELFADGGALAAYFAYQTNDLTWHIGRLAGVGGANTASAVDLGAGSFDDPTRLPEGGLVVREHTADGGSRLVAFRFEGPSALLETGLCAAETSCEGARNDRHVLTPSGEPLAFDRDEVSDPFALSYAGVTRIYYAGRRGTRWSLGMLVQGYDTSYFRPANDGEAILGAAGQGADALGVAAPTAFVRDGELQLLYAGTDGASWQLHAATMPIAP